jgi:DNA ligase-1
MTMLSSQAFYLLTALEEESSRLNKIELLRELLDEPLIKRIIVATYEPSVNYYLRSVPTDVSRGNNDFDEETWELLEALSERALTGNDAKLALLKELQRLNGESQRLLTCILERDLRVGIAVKSINAAHPKLITEVPYMRCEAFDKILPASLTWANGVYVQEKLDGMFAYLTNSWLISRKGKRFDLRLLPELAGEAKSLADGMVYSGELIVKLNGRVLDRKTGNGILNSLLQNGELLPIYKVEYRAWDEIPLEYFDIGKNFMKAYNRRFASVLNIRGKYISPVESEICHSLEEAFKIYDKVISLGGEGIVLKNFDLNWKAGTSKGMIKLKEQKEIDLVVIGQTPGTGKNTGTFGSLVCSTSDGKLEVNVGGFSDIERTENWQGAIVTVRYNGVIWNKINGKLTLFLPRFMERRLDKTTPDKTPC